MRCDDIQNTAELRSLNKKKILDSLRVHGALTKREIADYTMLSFATVSSLANQMEEDGMLQRGGVCTSNGGRMPALFSIRTDLYFLLAINFAIDNVVRMALMNLSGQRMYEWECTFTASDSYGDVLSMVGMGMQALLENASVGMESVLSGVAAVPAIYDQHNQTVINSTISLYENRRMADDLRALLEIEIVIENESNLMALACLDNGADHDKADDLIFLYIGEGLGIGVVSGNALLTGAHGFGGEISHIPLGRAGYQCYCGQANCVETELSISGFVRKYNERQTMNAIDADLPVPQQWQRFAELCSYNDADALAVVRENGALLGTLTAALVNLLDPQKVIIGGYIDQIADFLLPFVQSEMSHRLVVRRQEGVPIRFAKGYNRLITAGCGELAFAKWNP